MSKQTRITDTGIEYPEFEALKSLFGQTKSNKLIRLLTMQLLLASNFQHVPLFSKKCPCRIMPGHHQQYHPRICAAGKLAGNLHIYSRAKATCITCPAEFTNKTHPLKHMWYLFLSTKSLLFHFFHPWLNVKVLYISPYPPTLQMCGKHNDFGLKMFPPTIHIDHRIWWRNLNICCSNPYFSHHFSRYIPVPHHLFPVKSQFVS